MSTIDRMARSADLVQGMADRLGVNLGAGHPLTVARRVSQMTMACSGCAEHSACAALQRQTRRLAEPPRYCRNAARLEA